MKVHGELVTDALRPFHENLEKRFSELHTLIPKTPRQKTNPRVSIHIYSSGGGGELYVLDIYAY